MIHEQINLLSLEYRNYEIQLFKELKTGALLCIVAAKYELFLSVGWLN